MNVSKKLLKLLVIVLFASLIMNSVPLMALAEDNVSFLSVDSSEIGGLSLDAVSANFGGTSMPKANPAYNGFIAPPNQNPIPADAIHIQTATQLAAIGGAQSAGKYYVLDNDITITLIDGWTPIDDFRGTFDGRGHSINNLHTIEEHVKIDAGLFGKIEESVTIKNVCVNIGTIGLTAFSSTSGASAGGLVGLIHSGVTTITNCYVTGNVFALVSGYNSATPHAGGLVGRSGIDSTVIIESSYSTSDASAYYKGPLTFPSSYAGGLVGISQGAITIKNSYATGGATVSGYYSSFAGGLIGTGVATIENSYATGDVSAITSDMYAAAYAGGLIGSGAATIEKSYAMGDVSAAAFANYAYAGGLVGSDAKIIANSYAIGDVTATGAPAHAGGLAGSAITIENSYATGEVKAIGRSVYSHGSAGGLVSTTATSSTPTTIKNSYATCNVLTSSNGVAYAGGLFGYTSSGVATIEHSYATGDVSAIANDNSFTYAGGLTGITTRITVNNCYRLSTQTITGNTISADGTPLVPAQMRQQLSFIGWDFENIWTINPNINNGYPHFKNLNGESPLPDDVIHIRTATQLVAIGGPESAGKYYVLDNDINLVNEWTPINDFRGTLDGCGHTINNLYILESSNRQHTGLFGQISSASVSIKNIGINIGSNGLTGSSLAGGLIGYVSGSVRVENCYVTGDVSGISSGVGGLIGFVSSSSSSLVVENCYVTGDVSGAFYVGGLIGYISSTMSVVENCYATGDVYSVSYHAGGLIGYVTSSSSAIVKNCYATGDVYSRSYGVGGLIGSVFVYGSGSVVVENCYVTGDVSGSYSSGMGLTDVGGLIGYVYVASSSSFLVKNCYRLSTQTIVGGPVNALGTPLTPIQMRQPLSFIGWNFDTVWTIDPRVNNGYPHLQIFDTNYLPDKVTVAFHVNLADPDEQNVELSIPWSNEYFRERATVYNHDLAVATLVLANAAYDEVQIENMLHTLGFVNITKEYTYAISDMHRVAYAIASKEIDKDTTLVAITLRGTPGFLSVEMISNLDVFNDSGFQLAASRVEEALNKYLIENVTTQHVKFLITGHSRGAAVGNLVGVELSEREGLNNVFVYCFATPNTVIGDYRMLYQNIFNICNEEDIVCYTPPWSGKYGSTSWFYRENIAGMYEKFAKLTSGKDLKAVMSRVLFPDVVAQINYAHSPVTYMAYLLSGQTTLSNGRIMIISIKCPVDIDVCDNSGKLIGRVVGNTVDESVDVGGVFIWLDGDEKHFVLPFEGDYVFNMVGTDVGVMTYVVGYVDPDTWEMLEQKEFKEVELFAGKLLSSNVRTGSDVAVSDVRLYVINEAGGIVAEVLEDGTEITTQYAITATAETGGTVSGDGLFNVNRVATVTATPDTGYVFDGWYENNLKVSEDMEYSFIVIANRVLVARFMVDSKVVLESIAITTQPTKLVYVVGDVLDFSGLVVTAVYSDDSTSDVTTLCAIDLADGTVLDAAGTQTITVSYTEDDITKTITFTITVNSHEHDWVVKEIVEPTCEEQGYTVYECSYCGETKQDNYVPVIEHDYGEGVYTEPLCGVDGFWTFTCSVCGDIHVEIDEGSALEHNYISVVTTQPTCTFEGVMTYTCSNCDDSYTEPIEKLNHNYVDIVTEPTCEDKGYTTYTCSECGDSYIDDFVDALGHIWDEGVVTDPDCEHYIITHTCIICHQTYEEPGVTIGHQWNAEITIPPTTETEGELTYTCSRCGKTFTEVIPKLPTGNTITVKGVEIEFEIIDGIFTLKPTQEQMSAILNVPDKEIVFDLQEYTGKYTSVALHVYGNWFKDISEKTITIKTDTGIYSVTTKQLWNNSDKPLLVTVSNGKLQFKNL